MKSLKFLRSVLVYGVHREAGTTHEIEDREAALLIADRAADEVQKPAKVPVETAELKPSGKEKAAR